MNGYLRNAILAALAAATLFSLPAHAARGKASGPNPDFTKGDPIPEGATHDWNLGATGARGWMLSGQLETSDARQVRMIEVAIVTAIEKLAPSNEMFGDGIRLAGLDLLSRLHIREGMTLCVSVIEPNRWGVGKRLPRCLECLARYGTHAKEVLPQLREVRGQLVKGGRAKENSEPLQLVDKTMAAIQISNASPTVLDLKEFATTRATTGTQPQQESPSNDQASPALRP